MTTVILAEKPSQMRDIAKVIGIKSSRDGYIELSNGWVATHAVGHLLEQAQPEEYDPAWGGRWNWDQLPMLPAAWKSAPVKRTFAQLKVIKGLLATAHTCVIATDAGREGELIAREILEYARFKGTIKRFWTSSMVEADVRKALNNLLEGSATYPLFEAARARARSDFMLGLSGTRAASLAANVRGDFFALGRVKTPTLAMVVRRDEAIEKFGAKNYFELEVTVNTANGHTVKLAHAPAEEDRIVDKKVAQALLEKARGAKAPLRVQKVPESETAPLPYSLPALQKDANRVLGLSAQNTLKTVQALYEKKALTYPRTDCPYLAESQVAEIESVLTAVHATLPAKVAALRKAGVTARKSTFNDAKLSDHHGIIPTTQAAPGLAGVELQVYSLVAHRYLQAIAPDCKFISTRVSMDANGVLFKTSGKTVTDPGWTQFKMGADDGDE